MIAQGLLLPLNVIQEGTSMSIIHHDPLVWYVMKEQNPGVEVAVSANGNEEIIKIENDGLLMLEKGRVTVKKGRLIYRRLNYEILSKLLAFIDIALKSNEQCRNEEKLQYITILDKLLLTDKSKSEKWFIQSVLISDGNLCCLHKLLRRTECYKIVRYLLSNTTSNINLHTLGKIYGLSYSHFRRLCRTALGGKVKAELCNWRLVRCVLETIEGESDMTTIAHKYGYSSSSHFSADVKNKLGKSPRELFRHSDK